MLVGRDRARGEAAHRPRQGGAAGLRRVARPRRSVAARRHARRSRRSSPRCRASTCWSTTPAASSPSAARPRTGSSCTFALNHMAYYVLTRLLLDRLAALGAGAHRQCRVARPSSARSSISPICRWRGGYHGWTAYSRSKLANILFTRELARRIAGTGVTANCLHPGFVASRFGDNNAGFFRVGHRASPSASSRSRPSAAPRPRPISHPRPRWRRRAALYFARCRAAQPSAAAQDDAAARRLWDESARLAGLPAVRLRAAKPSAYISGYRGTWRETPTKCWA